MQKLESKPGGGIALAFCIGGAFAALRSVVLVNSGTAMAAEVFAQALRELRGAQVIGETTRGGVSLQKTFRLGAGGKGLRLTVARMFPPSGTALEGKGVEPDFKVELAGARAEELRRAWISASETALMIDPVYAKAGSVVVGPRPPLDKAMGRP